MHNNLGNDFANDFNYECFFHFYCSVNCGCGLSRNPSPESKTIWNIDLDRSIIFIKLILNPSFHYHGAKQSHSHIYSLMYMSQNIMTSQVK